MSGQYPGNYSPLGGGQFNPQQQQNMVNPGMMQMYPSGGVGVMNQVGMQSPSHVQQQQQQMMQQQMHMGGPTPQQQQQQMGMIGPVGVGVGPGGMVGAQMGGGMMQQQQQQQMSMGGPGPQQQQQPQPQQPGLIGAAPMQSQHSGGQPTQASTSMLASSQSNSHKEINIVALSRLGQETVQDITSRFQEIFAALKIIQPTANRDNNTEKKVQEYFRTIRLLFKRVRIIYEKCNDGYPQGMEYTNVESLIPYKDEPDHRPIEPTQCEEYRKALQENQELIDTVKLKNRQLREIIDRTRIIIWEINTMLSMRRS